MEKIDNHIYKMSRKELKESGSFNFKDGDIVICGKYRVWVQYGGYNRPSLLSTVSTEDDMRDLPMRKRPQYIRDFIEARPKSI